MTTPKSAACPKHEFLHRFLSEQLDEQEEARTQEHIDSCAECQKNLETVAGEPELWTGLRKHLANTPLADSPPPDASSTENSIDLESIVELLGPTDDPRMLGRLGAYEVVGLIGRGTTGIVLKALEPRLNRYVAIKLMSPVYSSNGSARNRFEREGRAVAAVSHEHVVPIYAVDDHRGLPYIVMKYIPGLSLEQRIERDGPLDACTVTRVGLQIAEGLAAAHAQGIVHRDVKPANVILESTVDRAMVTDFGLARVTDEASMTRSGTITGTPQYMSPEQARGDGIDVRSDLFSLGSLMYSACTGRPPFRAETVYGVINRVCESQPRPIRETNTSVPEWLAGFVDKLMSKLPDERFQSANDVAEELAHELAFLQNPTAAAKPAREWLPKKAKSWGGRKLIGAAILTAGVTGLGLFAFSQFEKSGESENSKASLMGGLGGAASNEINANYQLSLGDTQTSWSNLTNYEEEGDSDIFQEMRAQSFSVENPGTLTVRVDRGDVEIVPSESGDLEVTVYRYIVAEQQAEAQELAAQHRVELDQNGDDLTVSAFPLKSLSDSPNYEHFEKSRFRIAVPSGYQADVQTLRGGISIDSLVADIRAMSQGGNIDLGRITGSVWARTKHGDVIILDGCEGAVDVLTVGGDVYLEKAQVTARIRTSRGDVYLGESVGSVTVQASGGSVAVDGVDGPTRVHTEVGDVLVRMKKSPRGESSFSAAGGDVSLRVAEGIAASIEARGILNTSLPFEKLRSISSADGPTAIGLLNGGGPKVAVASTTGTLDIFRLEDLAGIEAQGLIAEENESGVNWIGGGALRSTRSGELGDKQNWLTGDASSPSSSGSPSGLGGSGPSGLGGSGPRSLGGSGPLLSAGEQLRWRMTERMREKTSGEPRAGALVTMALPDPQGDLDGYTLYLPLSYGEREHRYPILVYLQGAYGVGGEIADLNNWGLARLLRDEEDLSIERNRLLLDEFIVVCLHIQGGNYFDEPKLVEDILDGILEKYDADPKRIYATGLSAGGHGSWGLASVLPKRFAAIAPVGGRARAVDNFNKLNGMSIWIAHNRDDGVVSYDEADTAARRVEALTGERFLRTNPIELGTTDYLKRKLVFTSATNGGHDAWTDLYSNLEFYKWLLRQTK